jgi:hypothetical protein
MIDQINDLFKNNISDNFLIFFLLFMLGILIK